MVSDAVLIAGISGVGVLSTTVSTIVIAWFQTRTRNAVVTASVEAKETGITAAAKTEEVRLAAVDTADKTEAVRTTLEESNQATDAKLEEMAKVGKDTHTLVNSNMGVQLKLNSAVTKRLADITKDKDDIKAAKLAQTMFEEHVTKQAKVDAGHDVATKAVDEVSKAAMVATTQRAEEDTAKPKRKGHR